MEYQSAQETLSGEQERYHSIMDALDIAFIEWERGGGFYASEKYSEYALSDESFEAVLSNTGSLNTVHPDDIPMLMHFFKEHNTKKKKISVTLRMKMKDGSYRWTEMLSFGDFDESGIANRVIGIFRDVDKEWMKQNEKLQKAVEIAEKANAAKTAFLSRISHDMRTPLNGILGLTLLLKERVTDEKVIQDLSELELSGQYLLNLVNDTLDVSKIESGKLVLQPSICDGKAVFDNVLRLSQINSEAKHITVNVHADNLPFTMLYIDVGRVEQIVMNILGNAIKFTPEGGTIELNMRNLSITNGIITEEVMVQDNGNGMSEEFLPHIFDAFSQEDSTRTSSYQGTGLGLSITKQLLQLMGGSISIESEAGKGTCVKFTLPMPIATKEQVECWNKNKKVSINDKVFYGKRILLCEDHPLNAKITKKLLEKRGVKVEHAQNGVEGLELFTKSEIGYYSVILMDIRMPVMDGFGATKAIRALPRKDAKYVPIIAITANVFDEDIKLITLKRISILLFYILDHR